MRKMKPGNAPSQLRRAAALLASALMQVLPAYADPPAPPGDASQTIDAAAPAAPVIQNFAILGQATFLDQFHPGFHAAYSGPNSLDPGRRGDETFDFTLYGGVRPWNGAEIWVDPEVDQGFGLSNTLGLAAFSSGEAYKVGQAAPYVRVQKLFLRQTTDLGGQTQAVAPDQNQLGGANTADRIIATIGKFSVVDIFDTNQYAHDARNDFMNWAVIDGGAFDYAADAWGYAYGASLEWYQRFWTLRAGIFNGSATPNSKYAAFPLGSQFQIVIEAEARYSLFGQAGKIKVLGFQTRAKLATFAALENFFAANPDASNVDAESIRHLRNKFGGDINIEQSITADLGAFLRASLSDGRTEAYDFTDIDRSISGGFSSSGGRWNRPDDTVGVAYVVDNISKAHKDYFEQGGLGPLIGDGRLTNAAPEQVLETYYSFAVRSGIKISADYQLVNHPAYNEDRGPVHIFSGRLHVQF
jgi:high affinity Mn2+ porin